MSFNLKNTQDVTINIVNVEGKLVHSLNMTQVSGEISQSIDVSQFPKGIYFVKISNDLISETRKIVIQ
ncbi:MAG: T9SS type A sorting domain-containing protein [Flavobacteriia bacterium]|nr:T9SS type A sorting domain-containing protein [Flavobacteriia bacterium]